MPDTQNFSTIIGTNVERAGPLTRKVLDYARVMERLVPHARRPQDWAPLTEFVDTAEFERIGVFLETQDWHQYVEMLCLWTSATATFETTVRRIAELPGHVYFEIQERHFRGDHVETVNSMTVFTFNDAGKIRRLDVYLQKQP